MRLEASTKRARGARKAGAEGVNKGRGMYVGMCEGESQGGGKGEETGERREEGET